MASFHQLIVTESKWQCIVNVDSQNAKCERQQTPSTKTSITSTKTSINTTNKTLNLLTYVQFAKHINIKDFPEFPEWIEIDEALKDILITYNRKHDKPKISKVERLLPKKQKKWTLEITFVTNAKLNYTFRAPGGKQTQIRANYQNLMLKARLTEYSKLIYDRIEPTKKK